MDVLVVVLIINVPYCLIQNEGIEAVDLGVPITRLQKVHQSSDSGVQRYGSSVGEFTEQRIITIQWIMYVENSCQARLAQSSELVGA